MGPSQSSPAANPALPKRGETLSVSPYGEPAPPKGEPRKEAGSTDVRLLKNAHLAPPPGGAGTAIAVTERVIKKNRIPWCFSQNAANRQKSVRRSGQRSTFAVTVRGIFSRVPAIVRAGTRGNDASAMAPFLLSMPVSRQPYSLHTAPLTVTVLRCWYYYT